MHKFLRSIGFSLYQKDRDIDKLLDQMTEDLSGMKRIQLDEETNLCEIRKEVAPGMGIAVFGQMDREGVFRRNYYYPFLRSSASLPVTRTAARPIASVCGESILPAATPSEFKATIQ